MLKVLDHYVHEYNIPTRGRIRARKNRLKRAAGIVTVCLVIAEVLAAYNGNFGAAVIIGIFLILAAIATILTA